MPRGQRSRRRRGRRPLPPPATAPISRPVARPLAVAVPGAAEAPRERSITRFSARDYTYVRREVQRILVLSAAILITIVVLSFFIP